MVGNSALLASISIGWPTPVYWSRTPTSPAGSAAESIATDEVFCTATSFSTSLAAHATAHAMRNQTPPPNTSATAMLAGGARTSPLAMPTTVRRMPIAPKINPMLNGRAKIVILVCPSVNMLKWLKSYQSELECAALAEHKRTMQPKSSRHRTRV